MALGSHSTQGRDAPTACPSTHEAQKYQRDGLPQVPRGSLGDMDRNFTR